jgi:hypothetical protein
LGEEIHVGIETMILRIIFVFRFPFFDGFFDLVFTTLLKTSFYFSHGGIQLSLQRQFLNFNRLTTYHPGGTQRQFIGNDTCSCWWNQSGIKRCRAQIADSRQQLQQSAGNCTVIKRFERLALVH